MNVNRKLSNKWRDDEALERFNLISPLLDETMDKEKKREKRKEIAEKNCLSVRTIYRYENAYRDGGFEALNPNNENQQ